LQQKGDAMATKYKNNQTPNNNTAEDNINKHAAALELTDTEEENTTNYMSIGMSLGMCFGVAIGAAIGLFMGELTGGMLMGLSLGLCLGMAVGAAVKKNKNSEEKK